MSDQKPGTAVAIAPLEGELMPRPMSLSQWVDHVIGVTARQLDIPPEALKRHTYAEPRPPLEGEFATGGNVTTKPIHRADLFVGGEFVCSGEFLPRASLLTESPPCESFARPVIEHNPGEDK